MTISNPGDLNWLLDDLVDRLAGVRYAVVRSTDGLAPGRSTTMSRADAEHFAAMSATRYGLARSAGSRCDGGRVRQEDADLGMVAYEMNLTVQRPGRYLSTGARGSMHAERRSS